MAEESGQEKTEDPTPKRLQDAREKGDIPRSKELNATVLLLVAAGALLMFGSPIATTAMALVADNLALRRDELFDSRLMISHFTNALIDGFLAMAGFFAVVLLAALLGPIGLGGWNFSTQAIQPKLNRMDPLAGIKRMFSLKSLIELIKAFAKFLLVAAFAIGVLLYLQPDLFSLGNKDVNRAVAESLHLVGIAFLIISTSLILISLIDVPFQIYDYTQKLKMTLQEVKDEMKNTEGKPEVKGRIRQLQREIAQRQMMQEVPTADVVITNPTHYAVAIKYVADGDGAPIVVAKGAEFVALKIREIAQEHNVVILSAPALARALYHNSELDQEIPAALYKAVAQVLAYVFQLRRYQEAQGQADKPRLPNEREYEIPDDYRVDP